MCVSIIPAQSVKSRVQNLKACLHLTSFSPFNAAPFNGPFLFSIVFMKNGLFFYRMGIEPNLPIF